MKIYKSIDEYNETKSSVLTIGTFDGVHKGHELVFENIKNYSELLPAVITFKKSPKDVNRNLRLMKELDVKYQSTFNFSKLESFCGNIF